MNGTVVVIQDFCTRRCYARNEIHEGCSRSLKGPSAYTADVCDICIYFLIQEGRICSYCCGEEKREMLSGHNAGSYGHEFDSSEGLWGQQFFCWLQLTPFPFVRPLVGAPSFCIQLLCGIRHNRIQQLQCSIQCIFIIIYLYYHKSWKVSPWATLYYAGP